jgi:hemerythrin
MIVKTDIVDNVTEDQSLRIVFWENKYATGIEVIDTQHKKLIDITNELYRACLSRSRTLDAVFKESMSRMVEYVRYHFTEEQELLQRIGYPKALEHKRQHDTLIKQILEAAKDYDSGKKFVPNTFVRTLRDWVFGHIAVSDKIFSDYINEQKRKGLLSEAQLI